jgi:predicted dehydrogenase
VVIDKPMATSSAEAEALVEAAARAGRVLSVFHNRRWDADFLSLQAVLESGALGELVELTSGWDRFRPTVRDRWRERAEPGSGLWFDLGAHLVDQALVLFGPPQEITAEIAAERPGAVVDDRFHVRMRYASGLRVVLEARSVALAGGPRFVAHGTRGSLVKRGLDPQEAALVAGVRPGAAGWGVDPEPGVLTLVGDPGPQLRPAPNLSGDYRAFYAGVRDAIAHGSPPPVTGEDGLAVIGLLEAAAGLSA